MPLTMPMTRRMRSPASDSRSGRMSGMPPATDASNSRSTPAFSAASNSSSPKLASSSLFAVTTGLAAFSAARIRLRAGSTPPIDLDDDVDVGVGDDRLGVVREHAVGELDVALLGEVVHRDTHRPRSCTPVRCDDQVPRCSSSSRTSAAPTLPHPRMPDPRPQPCPQCRGSCIRCPSGSGRETRSSRPAQLVGVETHQVGVGLAANHEAGDAVAHEDDGRTRHLVVVGRHRVAVRARHRRREDVADREIAGQLRVADEQVALLAVLARDRDDERALRGRPRSGRNAS